jgi:hypothetical protein
MAHLSNLILRCGSYEPKPRSGQGLAPRPAGLGLIFAAPLLNCQNCRWRLGDPAPEPLQPKDFLLL